MRQIQVKHTINLSLVALFGVIILALALYEHHLSKKKESGQLTRDLPEIRKKGVLTALTIYSSTSYFIYRDKEMGYEYELCAELAESLGLELKVVTVRNVHALQDSLNAGVGDIVAYNVPLNAQIKKKFLCCGRDFLTYQVLVQQKNNPDLVTNVTQLVGKQVVVPENSCFQTRLTYLNDELGGGILIKPIKEDSLTTEELIEKVATGHIRYTVADNALARLNKTYYKNLSIATAIGFPQHSCWLVRKDAPLLASAVDDWFRHHVRSRDYQAIYKRYFERSKGPTPFLTTGRYLGKDGRISAYDNLFKKYGERYQLDWRLLASIAYQESKFDPKAVSWAGAVGIMQLMPKTAGEFDVSQRSLFDPEINIMTAARLFKRLERKLRSAVNHEQRTKMVLAGFNCGLGHVLDARALSRKYGKNPNRWDNGNVGHFIILKSQPRYYEDRVCKKGYLRGFETAEFVTDVWTRYQYYVSMGAK